jgi:iron(III) transport system permease protein
MIFVSAVYYAPYVFLPLNAALSLMNPEYEEAATSTAAGSRASCGP